MVRCVRQGVVVAVLVWANVALAAHAEEPPASEIVWRIGLYQGFKQACREQKPLVVFFFNRNCKPCDAMMGTLFDKRLGVLGDSAIFIYQDAEDEDTKGNVRLLIDRLGIKEVPTVVVLQVREHMIEEVGRVLGYNSPEETLRQLRPMLRRSSAVVSPALGQASGEEPPKPATLPNTTKPRESQHDEFGDRFRSVKDYIMGIRSEP
jgi:hypothetical protein